MNHPQTQKFSVRVSGDELVFSVAHFITYGGGTCEPLHGHDFHVAVEVVGPLDEDHCVIDFVELRELTRKILAELDHRVLLPTEHPTIRVTPDSAAKQINVQFEERHWSFPEQDCRLLPIPNTTAELMAEYLGHKLLALLPATSSGSITTLNVEVRESRGHLAVAYLKP